VESRSTSPDLRPINDIDFESLFKVYTKNSADKKINQQAEAACRLHLGKMLAFRCKLTGKSFLHLAAENGHKDLVATLSASTVNLGETDNFGCTPYFYASKNKKTASISALFIASANNALHQDLNKQLMTAFNGNAEILNLGLSPENLQKMLMIYCSEILHLPQHSIHFFIEQPAYLIMLCKSSTKHTIDVGRNEAAIRKQFLVALNKFHDVTYSIHCLFATINHTLSKMKYNQKGELGSFLCDVKNHLRAVFLKDTVKLTIIRNLLLSHNTLSIDVVDMIKEFNDHRDIRESVRHHVPTEVLIRLAIESGFQITQQQFSAEVCSDPNIQYLLQLSGEISEHTQNTGTIISGNITCLDTKDYLFDPNDKELNVVTTKIVEELIANKVNNKPASNITFFRIGVDDNHDIICIALSKDATIGNGVKNVQQYIDAYNKSLRDAAPNDKTFFTKLILIDPEHHAAKSSIPLLVTLSHLNDNAAANMAKTRASSKHLHKDGLLDHFKQCSELFGTGFLSQLLRKYPHMQVKSAANYSFNHDVRPMCDNCCAKKPHYINMIRVGMLVGIIYSVKFKGRYTLQSHSGSGDIKEIDDFILEIMGQPKSLQTKSSISPLQFFSQPLVAPNVPLVIQASGHWLK
jgi:hypothetical protein